MTALYDVFATYSKDNGPFGLAWRLVIQTPSSSSRS